MKPHSGNDGLYIIQLDLILKLIAQRTTLTFIRKVWLIVTHVEVVLLLEGVFECKLTNNNWIFSET